MRFLRHFTAVVLVLAVVVGLAMLWAHTSGGGSGVRRAPSHEAAERLAQIKAGVIGVHPDNGFHFANTSNLIRTCEIEAVLASFVIMVGAVRRRHRRMRRSATRTQSHRLLVFFRHG